MAPVRRSSAREPPSRIYASAPAAPRQKRFRPTSQKIKPATSNGSGIGSKRQSTLTQLDFAYTDGEQSSYKAASGAEVELQEESEAGRYSQLSDSESEWENRPTKRRRTGAHLSEAERKRQQTLTQMDGFLMRDGEDDWSIMEDEMDDVQYQDQEGSDSLSEHDAQLPKSPLSTSRYDNVCSPALEPRSVRFERGQRPPSDSGFDVSRTPSKPIKAEIPSSQSPAGTPLTAQNLPSQHLSPERTPLSEIHPNVLATRDLQAASSEKTSSKSKQMSPSKDTQNGGRDDYSDNENYMPDSSDADSDDEVGAGSPTKSIKRTNFREPSKRSISSLTPSRLRNSLKPVPSPTIRDTGHEQPIPTSQASTVEFASPRSIRKSSILQPGHVRSHRVQKRASIASSPASNGSPIQSRSRAMRFSMDSELPASLFDNVTQIASINNSADIITAAQMCQSSSP